MNEAIKQQEGDPPVLQSPVLFFQKCGCTYYHTTAQQIPRDDPDPPDDKHCQEMVPDGAGGCKLVMVRKTCIEGNCRIHDIQMVQDILQNDESRPGRSPVASLVRDSSVQLQMIREERAVKYRAMSHFNSKWTFQFDDVDDVTTPLQSGIPSRRFSDQFTEEEKRVGPHIVERYDPSLYNAQGLLGN